VDAAVAEGADQGPVDRPGKAVEVETAEVSVGDLLLIRPGAKVAVFTGLMDMTATQGKDHQDDWLATVLGHEIAHALSHHASARIAYERMYGPASGATAGLEGLAPTDRLKLLDLLGVGRHALMYADQRPDSRQAEPGVFGQIRELSFDRDQEEEADHIGVFLMTFAGYNPQEAVTSWERMERLSCGGRLPEILSDHPSDARRMHDLQAWVPRARAAKQAFDEGRIEPVRGR